jgi:hypothetical protein
MSENDRKSEHKLFGLFQGKGNRNDSDRDSVTSPFRSSGCSDRESGLGNSTRTRESTWSQKQQELNRDSLMSTSVASPRASTTPRSSTNTWGSWFENPDNKNSGGARKTSMQREWSLKNRFNLMSADSTRVLDSSPSDQLKR